MKHSYFLINLIVTVLAGILVYMLCHKKEEKIVVVDAIRLFNGYTMKTDLEKTEESKLRFLGNTADSLERVLKAFSENSTSAPDPGMINAYKMAKMTLESEYEASNKEINQQVWNRLNILLNDYGKAKHIGIIIGANGMGSVLYNDQVNDITEDVIKYVNSIYENKK